VEQFTLRPGDIVNPLMRPAGVMIPSGAGQRVLHTGFGQMSIAALRLEQLVDLDCSRFGPRGQLTPREIAVLRLASMGAQSSEVAKSLEVI
jgi:DNA-binding NarL/FixJ family response regulator